ncbi:nicotinate (nicotinamide) nucleotide adenylyltransferase [Candidatus Uabimicrobium amorphum]|uniref:Probable nicotinate-nucleotide adenylyltransferase n=1 Tax=Uabimicrobium amorphum TaxID=2596890 RepID=A0A5S9IR32_UABAM|nr:nicotinate (nicotinamide) nucleotide adenylyltransferase [Candidatus Uabimicrobium amorphum]BBM86563.1 putative nicotinate-nucleotide adenylyltransferase [Candidatus Uabimicrobium amorphum]
MSKWQSRIFVFGGSFNPIHNDHIKLALTARDKWKFDRIIFIPNGDNYRKKSLSATPAKIRFEMVQAAIADMSQMEVSDVEVNDSVAMRTPITMRELHQENPHSQLALFRGLDALHRVHRQCFQLANMVVIAVPRKGFELSFAEMIARHSKLQQFNERIIYKDDIVCGDLSSTQIRQAVAEGQSIDDMVPSAVQDIIKREGLYSKT